jgi:hypothetical protein
MTRDALFCFVLFCFVLFDTVGVITAVAALARAEPEVSGGVTPPAGDCSAIEINEMTLLRGHGNKDCRKC